MKLSLIGMSGIGKSYWARQLAQLGFVHLDCDAMIALRLSEIIDVQPNEDPVHAVGRWMGMPDAPGYAQREQQYLDLEKQVTAEALDTAAGHAQDQDIVIDTTGSVIYTGGELLARLKQQTTAVYLDVPVQVQQDMVELYRREPKPVLWQGAYRPAENEDSHTAMARCYAGLLADRATHYKALADVVLDYHTLRGPDFGVDELLHVICGA